MTETLRLTGYIDLPPHQGSGGFDHAAVHARTGQVYVAHTANDAVDVIDAARGAYLRSIPDLRGVAGALVVEERQLVITSNRAEDTIGIFAPGAESEIVKVAVGRGPNGLACDPARGLVLVANVGEPAVGQPPSLSIVDLDGRAKIAEIAVPGRTRWAVFDPETESFYVNIMQPAVIVSVRSRQPRALAHHFSLWAAGPHGLDIDTASQRLFCACDGRRIYAVDARSGGLLAETTLSGVPDVVFFNARHQHVYVAIGDPGVIDVFDAGSLRSLETVTTEKGAHTLAFSAAADRIYAFLPQTHRAAVFQAVAT